MGIFQSATLSSARVLRQLLLAKYWYRSEQSRSSSTPSKNPKDRDLLSLHHERGHMVFSSRSSGVRGSSGRLDDASRTKYVPGNSSDERETNAMTFRRWKRQRVSLVDGEATGTLTGEDVWRSPGGVRRTPHSGYRVRHYLEECVRRWCRKCWRHRSKRASDAAACISEAIPDSPSVAFSCSGAEARFQNRVGPRAPPRLYRPAILTSRAHAQPSAGPTTSRAV